MRLAEGKLIDFSIGEISLVRNARYFTGDEYYETELLIAGQTESEYVRWVFEDEEWWQEHIHWDKGCHFPICNWTLLRRAFCRDGTVYRDGRLDSIPGSTGL